MNLSPFRPASPWQRRARAVALGSSIAIHAALGLVAAANPVAASQASQWVEMAVRAPPPPKPEPPPPPPEPPKPKPKPKVLKFEELTPVPPPDAPPEPQRVVRRVQGLSASSFATTGSGGFQVKAGNTAATPASADTLDGDGQWTNRPYTSVTSAPRLKWQPPMEVPEEARKAEIQGTISVRLDLDATGRVTRVVGVNDLGFGTLQACIAAWKQAVWKPAEQDGQPVGVVGVPQKCTVILQE